MTYSSLQQLTNRYGDAMLVSLTDRAAVSTGLVDTSIVDQALADTDATVDGYLASRYTLPLVTVPPLIADLATSIAIWKLHTFAPDDKIKADFTSAMATLAAIAAGTVRIPVAGIAPAGTGGSGARVTDRERPMTADNLKGFI